MQGTGRRGAPSLFVTLPRTGLCTEPYSGPHARLCSGLCTEPYSGPHARLCSGPHGSHLLPHTVIAAPPLAPLPCRPHHCCSLRAVRTYSPRHRPHLRPPPVTSLPHSRPRRPPCLPLPGGFSPTFRCAFRTRHATNVCTFAQHAENKYVTIKTEKRQPPDRKQVAFFRFPGRTARRYRSVICTMLFFAYIGGRLSLTPYLHEKTCTQNALCRSHRAHGIAPLLPEG